MEMLEIIKKLCDENGVSVSALEKELGYGNGALTKAKKLPADRVYEISKRFNVPMEYIMSGGIIGIADTVAPHLDGSEYTQEQWKRITSFAKFVKQEED